MTIQIDEYRELETDKSDHREEGASPKKAENLCVIFGNPVAQSKSPQMQMQFAKNSHISLEYLKVLTPLDRFKDQLDEWIAAGIVGANITIPFKEEVMTLCDLLTPEAKLAKAVNTIRISKEGTIYGHNTDGIGLLRDITEIKGHSLTGKRVLILGAGGAVRGILKPLLDCLPQAVVITNRTFSRAEGLAAEFSAFGPIKAVAWDALTDNFDFIINATSASLGATFPPLPMGLIGESTIGYDLVYGDQPTSFMDYFTAQGGLKVYDGLGMLIEQGVFAFEFWFGVKPPLDNVLSIFGRQ